MVGRAIAQSDKQLFLTQIVDVAVTGNFGLISHTQKKSPTGGKQAVLENTWVCLLSLQGKAKFILLA